MQNNKNNNVIKKENKREILLSLPYIPETFEKVSNNLKQFGIQTVPQINNNLSNIIRRGKDRQEKNEQTNIVYRIDCKDCNASYVGESKRTLGTRVKEHIANMKKENKKFVINEHTKNCKHKFDFENTRILDRESNWRKRLISEMVNIKLQDNSINIKEDTQKLSNHYTQLIKKFKKS